MARQIIGIGSAPNDGTGDKLRAAGTKINTMTSEIYTGLGNGTNLDSDLAPFTNAEKSKLAATYAQGIMLEVFSFAKSEAVTTGNGKGYFLVPPALNGTNLTGVYASHLIEGTGAGTDTTSIQIHNATDIVDMLTTPITIDEDEMNTSTAATAALIDSNADDVVTGDILRIDVDTVTSGTPPVGLIVVLEFA